MYQNPLSSSFIETMRLTQPKISKSVTDDVRKLKELPAEPNFEGKNRENYYIEPVTIEYYVPKESRFANEIKNLAIELHDPVPKNEKQELIWENFVRKNLPIDIIEVMNQLPQFLMPITDQYTPILNLIEATSQSLQDAIREDPKFMRRAIYLLEVLHKSEPTLPTLEILGDYTTYNINWGVRFLNRHNLQISLEDATVELLIKRHLQKTEAQGKIPEERFTILSEIYLEQAFPHKYDKLQEEDDI